MTFAEALVAAARRDLGVTSDSQRVKQMLANYGIATRANWCAVAVGTWIHEAANAIGIAPPIPGSPLALETMRQFQRSNLWVPSPLAPLGVKPGMVTVWQRGPEGSGLGHIGVVATTNTLGFTSIEGNAEGGVCRENSHFYDSTSLLGAGYFNTALPAPSPMAAWLTGGAIVAGALYLAWRLK